jgi:hypothetical protein
MLGQLGQHKGQLFFYGATCLKLKGIFSSGVTGSLVVGSFTNRF